MAKLVSKVYGDALFSAALEENKLDEVWEEVRQISSILEENKAFVDIGNTHAQHRPYHLQRKQQ